MELDDGLLLPFIQPMITRGSVAAQGSDLIFGFQANFLFNLLALLS